MTVEELETQGYKVRFHHLRISPDVADVLWVNGARLKEHPNQLAPATVLRDSEEGISGSGGCTRCFIIKDDQVVAQGESWCNPMDNFCKATGRTKALGRAVGAMVGS